MLKNLKNTLIDEYFMDCTYKCVPSNTFKFKLMVLSGYDFNNNKTDLCCFILLMNEKEFIFINIFKILLNKYNFKNIMCDFRISQIKACKIFFHKLIYIAVFSNLANLFGIILKNMNYVEKVNI